MNTNYRNHWPTVRSSSPLAGSSEMALAHYTAQAALAQATRDAQAAEQRARLATAEVKRLNEENAALRRVVTRLSARIALMQGVA